MVKHKAFLATREIHHQFGIDYNNVFVLVVRFSTLNFLLALVAAEAFELHQIDVKPAFHNEELEEEIFMGQ